VFTLSWPRLPRPGRARPAEPPLADLLTERRLRDLILPAAIDEAPDHLLVDDRYVATLAVIGYRRQLPLDWLAPVLRAGVPVRVSLHLHPVERGAALRALQARRDDLDASRHAAGEEDRRIAAGQELADEDNEELEAALEADRDRLLGLSLYLTVSADGPAELEALQRALERVLGEHGFRSARLRHAQLPGFVAGLPLGLDAPRRIHPMTATAAAAAFPFAGAGAAGGGVLLGVDPFGGGLVELHPFDRAARGGRGAVNDHLMVLGQSGAGKSLAVKLIALRALPLAPIPTRPEVRAEVWAVDRDGEYRALADLAGGRVVTLAPGRHGAGVNPLELAPAGEPTDEPEAGAAPDADAAPAIAPLAERALRVTGLLGLLAGAGGRLTPRERTLATRAIAAAYERAGVGDDPATHDREPPTLATVQELLRGGEAEAADLALRLEPYTHGPFAGLFARRSVSPVGARVVAWDIRGLADDERLEAAGLFLVADAVWTAARRDRRPRLLIIDEVWKLIQHEAGAAIVADLIARGRKYGLALVLISQEIRSLLESRAGYRMVTGAARKLLHGQGHDEAALPLLAEALGLGPGERAWLRTGEPGRALLLAGDERRAVRIEASPEELAALTTDPVEALARAEPPPLAGRATREPIDGLG
jgi:type IV secretory pathway VirB4 component